MTFKKKKSFGTVLGGCLSCCASLFVLIYVSLVLSSYIIVGRDYDQATLQKYQPVVNPPVYNLTQYDMIPVVAIKSFWDDFNANHTYNDESLWKIKFYQVKDMVKTEIPSMTCDKYIDTYLGDLNA